MNLVTCSHPSNVENFIRQINDYDKHINDLLCEKEWLVKIPKVKTLKTYLKEMNKYKIPDFVTVEEIHEAIDMFRKISKKAETVCAEWYAFSADPYLSEDMDRFCNMISFMAAIKQKALYVIEYCTEIKDQL